MFQALIDTKAGKGPSPSGMYTFSWKGQLLAADGPARTVQARSVPYVSPEVLLTRPVSALQFAETANGPGGVWPYW